ncbi:type I restriction enzyme, S subunit [Pseudomonas sp. NFACC15-1]|uniref:restriction endonuclease subunit S n=1 Tax=unclassified Pseudomonas TaxID=196821 RepID=UPI0008819E0A|nr:MULTISPECIES: restriction endonuclease subunit S [unclassified Pseudomonas]SDA41113.1 type I restriction enzyme, S subunit [Pseudomonas sp. NFACC15-1]SDW37677.1 type I restriction enzyme, S subunit [Pseudomonas sp. NFACC14]
MNQMPMINLGECFRVKHGFAFKGAYFAKSGNYVVLTPGNFREDGGLKSQGEKEKYYCATPPDEYILSEGDLLIVMTDLTQEARILGSPAVIPRSNKYLHNQRLGLVTQLDQKKLTKEYLYYLLNWSLVRNQIKATATGSTVRHTAPDRIHAVQVRLPSLAVQHRIASILSAYDDLIENNTQRIEILEEMARRLYEEWFVQFRFPGYEEITFTESELGLVPEGWRVAQIREAYLDLYDGPHATPKKITIGPIFLGIKNIKSNGGLDLSSVQCISDADFPKWTKRVTPQEGDIVFSYEATLNRYAIIPRGFHGCLGRRLALIRPISSFRCFLYMHFFSKNWRDVISRNTLSGATVDRIPLSKFPEFPLLLPSEAMAGRFEALCRPILNLIEGLTKKNTNLRAQRDLLLPKLVSGEIDVSDIPMPT